MQNRTDRLLFRSRPGACGDKQHIHTSDDRLIADFIACCQEFDISISVNRPEELCKFSVDLSQNDRMSVFVLKVLRDFQQNGPRVIFRVCVSHSDGNLHSTSFWRIPVIRLTFS